MKKKVKYLILVVLITLFIVFIKLNSFEPEDVNRDGKVDILDLLKVQKHIIENEEEKI